MYSEDYYSILGIPRHASLAEIESAYKDLVMKHHPDRHRDPVSKNTANKRMQLINEAYCVLRDPVTREPYDLWYDSIRNPPPPPPSPRPRISTKTVVRIITFIAIVIIIGLARGYIGNTNPTTPPPPPLPHLNNTQLSTLSPYIPSIANGGTNYRLQTNDWIDTLNWIAKDTPKNSVIAAWRDYGYWITTLGHKTSLADNATINQTRIATIAKMFIDQKENGIKIAQDLKADYILVFVVGQRFSGVNGTAFYTLGKGGDESKKQWFMRTGGFDETNYLQADGFTATPRFWNTTLLGQIIPFAPQAYATFQGGQLTNLQPNYAPRTVALYVKHIKFPVGSNPDNQPLSLVYSSPSFQSNNPGLVFGVLVYKVNHNYVPKITSNPYHEVFVNVTQQPSQQQLKPLQPFSPSSSHPIRSSIPSSGQGTPITNNVTGIFNQVKNSIVQISARANPSEGISTRIESGFIYDTQGHIFTTNDVINGDNTALVAFADGNTYSAKVIGTDPSNDLAVLQITDNFSHENLVPLSMANSYGLQVGQQVIAIGHPFGLNYTMTTGIITQWVRLHFPATGYSISDVIQSNAPINPGSFGGPLLNRDGQVIGMNIAISSSTGEFSGIGFAIPSNIIISEVPRIIQTGTCSNCTR